MAVTPTLLLAGPADVYRAVFGATEPATPSTAPAVAWVDLGGTQGGLTLKSGNEYMELDVDQIVDIAESRRTKRTFSLATNLAEITLENLATALNYEATTAVTTATNVKTLAIDAGVPGVPEVYSAILFDGRAPSGKRRRVIIRRALNVADIEQSFQKDGQTLIPVEWRAHYVSASIRPIGIQDDVTP